MSDIFKIIFGMIIGPIAVVLGLVVMYATFRIIGVRPEPVISVVIALTPLWLPYVLFYLTYDKWMDYVRTKFRLDNGRTTLRIRLPQEVFKSPEAMENVLTMIHNPSGADNLYQGWVDGRHALTFSFELVSIGGDVRFYANVPTKKTKNAFEAQMYAQYPGVEVIEEPIDYAGEVTPDPKEWEIMSFHVVKKEDQVFPIKVYSEFGLDKNPKEEEKIEPMAAMLEQLGAIGPNERLWIQILAVPHAKRGFKNGYIKEEGTWEKAILAKIDAILGRNSATKLGPGEFAEQPRLTAGERDAVGVMERGATKYAYETAIRVLYAAKAGKFNPNALLILKTFAQYDVIKRNALGVRWRTDFDNNWLSDRSGEKRKKMKAEELTHYKIRAYEPKDKPNDAVKVMSVEELATLWHLPGSTVMTPGLARIPSTRREAPPNLPVGQL